MRNLIYGYMRISTTKDTQTTERQKLTLKNYARANGFEFDKLWEEQVSGAVNTENRPIYTDMVRRMGKGDVLVITDLDRLGRNADNIIREMKNLKEYGIKVIALDMPYLCDWNKNQDDSMHAMITDILITLKAHMAQQEREKISERVRQGMAAAKENPNPDKYAIGRRKAETTDEYKAFAKLYKEYLTGKYGKLSKTQLASTLGIGRTTLYKYIDIYERQNNIVDKKVEAVKKWMEKHGVVDKSNQT